MRIHLPAGARALVREPGPRVAETVHALLDGGATVAVEAAPGSSPVVDDLASRRLITLVETPDLTAFDVVIKDPADNPSTTDPGVATGATSVGEVVLVGGGPGDPGLLTLDGLAALQAADVVVTDRLAPLAVLDTLEQRPEIIHVGKIPRGDFTPQERINAVLLEQARAGRRVVRLKGGDNYVFGRGGEEWNACIEAGIPVRIVPGVSSAIAGPALAGIPVTHRELTQGFVVVTGHVTPDDPRSTVAWDALARCGLTLVILMGVAALDAITTALVEHGLAPDTPSAMVSDAGMASQRVVRASVSDLAAAVEAAGLRPPAVTVIGPTVDALLPGS